MYTRNEPMTRTSRHGPARYLLACYWLATAAVVGEMGLGGVWDIARLPFVTDLVTGLGYPTYFLVLLGTWKVLGAFALLIPGRPLLKEWAYAGAFFTYTGAMVSHLTTGYALGEVGLLAIFTILTVLSWGLRPPSRRVWRQTPTAPLVTNADPAASTVRDPVRGKSVFLLGPQQVTSGAGDKGGIRWKAWLWRLASPGPSREPGQCSPRSSSRTSWPG